MNDLQQFHSTANAFLALVGLPEEVFEHDQEQFNIRIEDRFTVRLSVEASGVYLFEGDWLEGVNPEGLHGDWLMANQICPGALQPVMALNENGKLTCWLRMSRDVGDANELVEGFDMLLGCMDQVTPGADA
ncbi:MAG TPA: hypothetical protein VGN04_09045 [Herbaspirillum sp.]|jgi:hypothetical protein